MTMTKYTLLATGTLLHATAAYASEPVTGAQEHKFGSTPGYIGTKINATENTYNLDDIITYTLDVFAQTAAGAPVAVSGFDIAVKISPSNTLNDRSDDILLRTFSKSYTPSGFLTQVPEIKDEKPIPNLSPGRYAIYTSGTIGGIALTKGAYDTFEVLNVRATPSDAPDLSLFSYFSDTLWDFKNGRYGANWMFPRGDNRHQGVKIEDGIVKIDRIPLSHNFEFKVPQDCNACSSVTTSEGDTIALYAVHAELGKKDIDGDIDLCTARGSVTRLEFNQSYEVKQHSRNSESRRIGRTYDKEDVTPNNPTSTLFAGYNFPADRSDNFYLVKVAFTDTNGDKILDAGETVKGIDALALEIDNKAPNPVAAFIGGLAIGLVGGYFIPDLVPMTPGGIDLDYAGTGGFGAGDPIVQ